MFAGAPPNADGEFPANAPNPLGFPNADVLVGAPKADVLPEAKADPPPKAEVEEVDASIMLVAWSYTC